MGHSGCVQSGALRCRPVQRCPIVLLATALTAAAVGGCGHGGGEHRASPPKQSAAQASPAARPAGPLRVSFRLAARFPAPGQLPAVAQSASGALVMGGLDQADASSAAIVRVAKQRAVRVGTLPAALHDAAAGRVGGRVLFMGGGNAGSTSAAIDAVSGRGQVTRVGALPRAASDVAAASVGKYA